MDPPPVRAILAAFRASVIEIELGAGEAFIVRRVMP
jgi:hypothetical protein